MNSKALADTNIILTRVKQYDSIDLRHLWITWLGFDILPDLGRKEVGGVAKISVKVTTRTSVRVKIRRR